jgi:hypothetical protein
VYVSSSGNINLGLPRPLAFISEAVPKIQFLEQPHLFAVGSNTQEPACPADLVEEVVKMDTAIQLAQDKMEMIARDPELLRAYEQYEKAASDWTTEINGARREAHREEKTKIAKNLKSLAIPVDKITVATGLSPEEIAKL